MSILDCSIENCGKEVFARGWCRSHWTRWRRHGDPLAGGVPAGSLAEFFRRAVSYDGDQCLFWPFGKGARGRPVMWRDGRQVAVHRAVCEAVNGAPPTDDHHGAHLCGMGHLACVNPKHLVWATAKENEAHKLIHGTRARGETHGMSVLTEDAAAAIKALRGEFPQSEIAKMFGVSKTTVGDIHRGRTWGWLS